MYTDRPSGLGDLVWSALGLVRASFLPALPLLLLAGVIAVMPDLIRQATPPPVGPDGFVPLDPNLIAVGVFNFLAAIFVVGAVSVQMDQVARGGDVSVVYALSRTFARFFPLFGAMILYYICVAVGIVLMVIPGLVLMISLIFVGYCVLLDDRGPVDALRYSRVLVKGHWWRTSAMVGFGSIPMAVLSTVSGAGELSSMLVQIDPDTLAQGLPSYASSSRTIWITFLGGGVTHLFLDGFLLVTYTDLKLRQDPAQPDGIDILTEPLPGNNYAGLE